MNNEIKKQYDLVIVGAGPAGMTAAIYAARAEMDFIVTEKEIIAGGQIINTSEVDNYPGLYHLDGFSLGMKFRDHAKALGATMMEGELSALSVEEAGVKKLTFKDGTEVSAKAVILAGGATHRKLSVKGEDAFAGRGVSYCATCDGAFFKNKVTAVVGGGDVALEDALFLAGLCEKVYLIHRRDEFRAAKSLVSKVTANEKIEICYNTTVSEIMGTDTVEAISVLNRETKEESRLSVSGIFVAVGMLPQTEIYKETVLCDETGYIVAGEDCMTKPAGGQNEFLGIFAAGDIRTKQLRQVVTAASDGANAITSVERYLRTLD